MKRRILVAILSVTVLAVVLLGVPLAITLKRFVDEDATLRLERQATRASLGVPESYLRRLDPVELPPGSEGATLALYDPSGQLVAGRGPAAADSTTSSALRNRVTDDETSSTRVVAVPITANERVIGAIRAEQPTTATNHRMLRIGGLIFALAAVVIGIGAAMAYVLAGRLARPVKSLRDAAKQLGEGDFTVHMSPSDIPELEQARLAITDTARRLDDLVQRERAFSTDASHQLRTPLAGLRTSIETELEFPRNDPGQLLREALDDVERLESTVRDLLAVARTPGESGGNFLLEAALRETTATWHGRFAAAGRRLVVANAGDDLDIRGNPSLLKNALDALLDNALLHGAGLVRVDHHNTPRTVTISVSDEGPGFDGERSGPPSTTDAEPLHGLGLPFARRLISQMPGRIVVASTGPNPRIDIVLSRDTSRVDPTDTGSQS